MFRRYCLDGCSGVALSVKSNKAMRVNLARETRQCRRQPDARKTTRCTTLGRAFPARWAGHLGELELCWLGWWPVPSRCRSGPLWQTQDGEFGLMYKTIPPRVGQSWQEAARSGSAQASGRQLLTTPLRKDHVNVNDCPPPGPVLIDRNSKPLPPPLHRGHTPSRQWHWPEPDAGTHATPRKFACAVYGYMAAVREMHWSPDLLRA